MISPRRCAQRPSSRQSGHARGPLVVALSLGLAAGLLAACSDDSRTVAAAPTITPTTTTAADSPTPSPTSTPGTSGAAPSGGAAGTVTLAFAGDVHFADQVADLLDDPDQGGLADLRPLLAGADLSMVNLETAITGRGREMPKQFHFRTDPRALGALRSVGVDVVTMANNHAVDYGPDGLTDTLAARAASPIPVVGIGKNAADAYAPAVLTVKGVRVAVLGGTQVPDWTLRTWPASDTRPGVASSSGKGLTRLVSAVRRARTQADVVVVYLHWGTDYTSCPDAAQKRTAKALAEAGADVVLGSHAHRVQGSGWGFGSYVGYGLGNFVWWRWRDPADTTTGVLTLTVATGGAPDAQGSTARVVADRWTPLRVRADGVPRPGSDAADTARLSQRRSQAQACSGLSSRPPGR